MNVKHISNPLTIIGMFCGIAEVTGTVVLTQVTGFVQSVLLWFVVGFPTLTILLFFSLLFSKHYAKLYSPSDYQNHPELFVEILNKMRNIRETVKNAATEDPNNLVLTNMKIDLDHIMNDGDFRLINEWIDVDTDLRKAAKTKD